MQERINGERFTVVEPTPLLGRCIEGARRALEAAGVHVDVGEPLDFGAATELTPTLAVWAATDGPAVRPPDLVVELRTESTSRYVLGPKRMAYARNAVPELWFVDPWHGRVAVLVAGPDGDFPWPPGLYDKDAVLTPTRLPGARISMGALLAEWPADRGREPADDELWYEL